MRTTIRSAVVRARATARKCARSRLAFALQSAAAVKPLVPRLTVILALAALVDCGGQRLPAQDDGGGAPPVALTPSSDLGSSDAPSDAAVVAANDLATADDLAAPPPPAKKTLPFTWQGEVDYYMCGPSAARMALSTRTANPPSQQELANYMGTDTNGTDYIGLVRGALDHYLDISAYRETDLPTDPPSQAQQAALKQALVASIDAGFGLVANVVSGWRPPGYPSGTIYHYVALVGYDAHGDKVLVADPAATGCGDGLCGNPSSGFYNVPKSYWINTSDLGVWITPKGYTWHP